MTHAVARRFTFDKQQRLLSRGLFLKVQGTGQKVHTDCVLALVVPRERPDEVTRLGLTVSSKVGNAVVRNRVRRRLRTLFRTRRDGWPKGLDVVLIARQRAATAGFGDFVKSVERLEVELKRRYPR